jgi:uncharacterized small protein (TIGR04563 family)
MASSSPNEHCKKSFYFSEEMLQEIVAEARRLDRPISWVMQRAWKTARLRIRALPAKGSPDKPSDATVHVTE